MQADNNYYYITSIDRSKPMGRLVDEFCQRQWGYGFFAGLCIGSTTTFILMKAFGNR
jgi:hypothetical protein